MQARTDFITFAPTTPAKAVPIETTTTSAKQETEIEGTLPGKPKKTRKKREHKKLGEQYGGMGKQLDVFLYKIPDSNIGSLLETKDKKKQLQGLMFYFYSHRNPNNPLLQSKSLNSCNNALRATKSSLKVFTFYQNLL